MKRREDPRVRKFIEKARYAYNWSLEERDPYVRQILREDTRLAIKAARIQFQHLRREHKP